ncbi:MAG: helix-turn-helix transcriptional regulator [Phaeodactylibacter sp.]|uniref:AraC family transcriptional regulator n=1 Tax=Phaeodactylibacter sp. TaxID=1940289 RepID=UPI0032EDFB79
MSITQLDQRFEHSDAFPKIEVEKSFRFIEYRAYERYRRVPVWSAQHFIVFVLQGKTIIETGGAKFPVTADEALFLRKGSYLMSEMPLDQGVFQSALFFLDAPFLKQFARRHSDLLPSPNRASQAPGIRLHVTEPMSQFYHAVLPYFNTPLNEARRRGLTLKLEELLLNLIAEPQNESFALFLNGLLQSKPAMTSVMEQNFMLNLPLAQFAQLSQRSLSAFKREFKEAFDCPPAQWLHNRRLKHAAYLLEHTAYPITQTAMECGFKDLSHFSADFKAAYGCSPSHYRKRATAQSL